MSGTRIPLELIQKVFFDDGDNYTSEDTKEFVKGEANDFKVQKNPPPAKKTERLPPYPKMDKTPIKFNVPKAFYRTVVYPVNEEKDAQKETQKDGQEAKKKRKCSRNRSKDLYTSLNETSEQRLARKRAQKVEKKDDLIRKRSEREIDDDEYQSQAKINQYNQPVRNVPPDAQYTGAYYQGVSPDNQYAGQPYQGSVPEYQYAGPVAYKEGENMQARNGSEKKKEEKGKKKKGEPSIYKNGLDKYIENGKKARENAKMMSSITKLPKYEKKEEADVAISPSLWKEEAHENRPDTRQESQGIPSYLTDDFQPKTQTRADQLRNDYIRRKLYSMENEKRKDQLNREMHEKAEADASKRLSEIMARSRIVSNRDNEMRKKKQKLREDNEAYQNMLKATQDGVRLKGTLLERVENEIYALQVPKQQKQNIKNN